MRFNLKNFVVISLIGFCSALVLLTFLPLWGVIAVNAVIGLLLAPYFPVVEYIA